MISQATALQTTSMNNMTALQSTKMMNDTAIKTGQIGASAMLGTANINSMTQYGIQRQNQVFEDYLNRTYPQNAVGAASAILKNLMLVLGGGEPTNGKSKGNIWEMNQQNLGELGRFVQWLKGK